MVSKSLLIRKEGLREFRGGRGRPPAPAANMITLPMCSCSGRPISSAPRRRSSRETARAKALSFIRLTTDDDSRSRTLFDGRMSAQAVTKPAISSQAYRQCSRRDSRGDAGVVRVRQDGTGHPLGISLRLEDLDPAKRVVLLVGKTLVVEIVQQRHHRPLLFGLAPQARISAHRGFNREHVLAQALALRVFGDQRPGSLSRHRHNNAPYTSPIALTTTRFRRRPSNSA